MPSSVCSSALRLFPIVVALLLVACGNNSPPQPSPTPTPSAVEHLYANSVDQSGVDRVLLFDLPLTNNSVPSFTAMASPFSRIAVDANGNVATLDINCNLTIYNAPLSSPLIPSVTLSSGANCRPGFVVGLAFNASGDLFVTNGGSAINVFLHPLSSTSTVSQVITVPNFARDLEFDATGNLYVASEIGGLCSFINNTVYIFIPPYTAAPAALGAFCGDFAFSSVAVSQTQMFVSQDNGFVRVFDLPATATSNSFLLTTTSNVGATLGVDHSGNLYVNDGQIHVFALPVSPASTPSVTLNVKVGDITFKP